MEVGITINCKMKMKKWTQTVRKLAIISEIGTGAEKY
jgi:hypothetical protein